MRPIEELKEEIEVVLGGPPAPPVLTEEPVAVVKWVDGTLLDTVWRVA
jgi:citrate lyase subunit alpha/citrate CoA-transferase